MILSTVRVPLHAITDGLVLVVLINIHDMLAVGIAVQAQIGIIARSRVAIQGTQRVSLDGGDEEGASGSRRDTLALPEMPFDVAHTGLAIVLENRCCWEPLR
jgi:hypothetical protein